MSQCSDCMYARLSHDGNDLQCHRNPPDISADPYLMARRLPVWPLVLDTDWCGEYAAVAVARDEQEQNDARQANDIAMHNLAVRIIARALTEYGDQREAEGRQQMLDTPPQSDRLQRAHEAHREGNESADFWRKAQAETAAERDEARADWNKAMAALRDRNAEIARLRTPPEADPEEAK